MINISEKVKMPLVMFGIWVNIHHEETNTVSVAHPSSGVKTSEDAANPMNSPEKSVRGEVKREQPNSNG